VTSRKIRATVGLVASAALATLVAARPTASAASGPSASGHGYYSVGADGAKRQFSFNAITQQGGVVTGNAEVHNPAFD
jgi:hypothetical protein